VMNVLRYVEIDSSSGSSSSRSCCFVTSDSIICIEEWMANGEGRPLFQMMAIKCVNNTTSSSAVSRLVYMGRKTGLRSPQQYFITNNTLLVAIEV
jgi:hypothetical protein